MNKVSNWFHSFWGKFHFPISKSDRERIFILPAKEAISFLLGLIIILAIALFYGNPLVFFLFSIVTAVTFVSAIGINNNLSGLGLSTHAQVFMFLPDELPHRVFLTNHSEKDRGDIEIVSPWGVVGFVKEVAAEDRAIIHLVPPKNPGIYRLNRVKLQTNYPFLLFRSFKYQIVNWILVVPPLSERDHEQYESFESDDGENYQISDSGELISGAKYIQGPVPWKRVDWKMFAQTGRIMMREREENRREELFLSMDDYTTPTEQDVARIISLIQTALIEKKKIYLKNQKGVQEIGVHNRDMIFLTLMERVYEKN